MFEFADNWVIILQMIHILLQSTSQAMIVSIASKYFKRAETHRVQMIAFLLILNWNMHLYFIHLYNDGFFEFSIILCMYLASSKRPVGAVAALSVATSLKAGGLLLVPALLGWV